MNLIKKIKIIFLSFLSLLIPVGICTWAISGVIKKEQLKAEYVVSPFTEYVLNPTNGSVIYDDTTNGSGFLGYDVSSDFTYDSTKKTIEFGDPSINGGISVSNSIVFAHAQNSELNYSQEQFTSANIFAIDSTNGAAMNDDVNDFIDNNVFTIKLMSDLTIKSNVTVSIGAKIGNMNSSGVSGAAISGDYICLDLNGFTITIEEGATLNCYGYLIDSKLGENSKHVGKVNCYGTIYTGFVVEDFHGGANTVGRGFASQMPFSIYSIPYLSCKVVFEKTGKLICNTMLYANGIVNKATLNWLGNTSDYFIQYMENSTVTIDTYNPLKKSVEYNKNMESFYYFKGNFIQNNLSLTIPFNEGGTLSIKAIIDMAQFSFFIPPYAKLNLIGENSTFTFSLNLLFMPGAELNCERDTTLIFSSKKFETKVVGTIDFPLVGPRDINLPIKEGTSYAGIVSLSQLPPCMDTSYDFKMNGVTSYPYSFDYDKFYYYDLEEIARIINNESRVTINGRISFLDSGDNIYTLAGLQEIGDDAILDLNSNINKINCFYKEPYIFGSVDGKDPLVSWATSFGKEFPTNLYFAGYTNLPLIISNFTYNGVNGLVFSPKNEVFSGFSNYVIFDLLNGYYIDLTNNRKLAFFLNEGTGVTYQSSDKPVINGSFESIEVLDEEHAIISNGIKYIYFNGTYVDTNIVKQSENGSGFYILNSDGNYNLIRNGAVEYTYDATIISRVFRAKEDLSGEFATRVWTQKRKLFGGMEDSYSEWNNLPSLESGHLISEQFENQSVTSTVNVSNATISTSEDSVNLSKQEVDLSQFSLGGAYTSSYQNSGLTCTLSMNGEEILQDSGNWAEVSDYENHLNADAEWTIDSENFFGQVEQQHKNQRLDWYYFTRTAKYYKSAFSQENIILYKEVLNGASTLKFNQNTLRWMK